jgi:hypothetical protein
VRAPRLDRTLNTKVGVPHLVGMPWPSPGEGGSQDQSGGPDFGVLPSDERTEIMDYQLEDALKIQSPNSEQTGTAVRRVQALFAQTMS